MSWPSLHLGTLFVGAVVHGPVAVGVEEDLQVSGGERGEVEAGDDLLAGEAGGAEQVVLEHGVGGGLDDAEGAGRVEREDQVGLGVVDQVEGLDLALGVAEGPLLELERLFLLEVHLS